mmetsp:Transcript_42110/g.105969  ORF Transcript_42110/g.105969 Transcript_42110/m.105969 type:complete len:202 (-) Transcript_42110:35-640(-)
MYQRPGLRQTSSSHSGLSFNLPLPPHGSTMSELALGGLVVMPPRPITPPPQLASAVSTMPSGALRFPLPLGCIPRAWMFGVSFPTCPRAGRTRPRPSLGSLSMQSAARSTSPTASTTCLQWWSGTMSSARSGQRWLHFHRVSPVCARSPSGVRYLCSAARSFFSSPSALSRSTTPSRTVGARTQQPCRHLGHTCSSVEPAD